jgi:hypothetical protein
MFDGDIDGRMLEGLLVYYYGNYAQKLDRLSTKSVVAIGILHEK